MSASPLTEPQICALRAAEASPDGLERWRTGHWYPTYRGGRRTPIRARTVVALLRRGCLRVQWAHGIERARITATGSAALAAR